MTQPSKTNKIANLTLIFIFACTCYLPLIQTIITPAAAISETEKRKLAEAPTLEMNRKSIESFSGQFERYFKDHFGFRNLFIFLNSYVSVKWLEVSPISSVILGKDGWLYWNKNQLTDDFRGAIPMTSLDLEQWKNSFEDKQEWLARKGIAYIAGFAPEKQTLYPEFLPDHLQNRRGVTRLTQLETYLQQHSTFRLLDWKTTLLSERKKHQIYYKTDTHWNFRGGLAAYQALMTRMSAFFPDMVARPESFYQERISADHEGGDLALTMGLQTILHEDRPIFQPRSLCGKRWPYDVPLASRGSYAMGCETQSRKAVVFRDSYFNFILPFLSEHFVKIIYIWDQYNQEIASQLIQDIGPDVVIEEILERFLIYAPVDKNGSDRIQNDLAPYRFDRSRLIYALPDQKNSYPLSPVNDLTVVSNQSGLILKSTGPDPQFMFPDCIPDSARSLFLKIRITSPTKTELQIFYRIRGEMRFSEQHSVIQAMEKGYNELYLQIPGIEYSGPLRIDPGKTPGNYILHSIEIRG